MDPDVGLPAFSSLDYRIRGEIDFARQRTPYAERSVPVRHAIGDAIAALWRRLRP
jgi:hypothetical protein